MASSKGYMAKIGLDTSDIDKNIRSLSKELKAIDAGLKENGNSAVLAEQKFKALGEQYAAYRKKLEELQSAQQKMNNALASGAISETDYRSYEREVESVTRAIEKARAQQKAFFEGSSGDGGDVDYQQLANMADAFKDIGSKANEAADVIATTFINAVKAAGIQVKDIVDQATKLYGDYQQLEGGVETLFGDDYTTVMKNADNAFKNMGVSANTYMDTAMSFAASLVSSLEGDTEQAAKTVDLALQDMADNANKMGTSMGMIQNAYQGFAKQNYTMLDNLKLGYGGTKKEMERLLADAQKLTGVKYDISSLDDVINAIHAIQTNIGITGTTALEAEHTITGSAAAVKAAWENLLTAMADPNGGHDLKQMVKDFVDTAVTSIDNMMPSIEAALLGMGDVIEDLAPIIEEKLPQLIDDIAPAIVTATSSLVNVATQAIIDNLPLILDSIHQIFDQIMENTDGSAKAIIAAVAGAWTTLKGIGIAGDLAGLITQIGGKGGVLEAIETLSPALSGKLIPAFQSLGTTISTGLASLGPYALAIAGVTAAALLAADALNKMAEAEKEAARYRNGFDDTSNDALDRYAQLSNASEEEALKMAQAWKEADEKLLKDAKATQTKLKAQLEHGDFLPEERAALNEELEKTNREIETLTNLTQRENKIIEDQIKADEAAFQASHTRTAAYREEAAAMAEMAKSGNTNATIISDIYKRRAEELDSTLSDLDSRLAKHQLTEDEYWAERLKAVERYRNEDDEKWWGYYDKIKDHYDKQAKAEADAAKDAEQKRLQAMKEAEAQTKADLEDFFREIETQAVDEGQSDEWIVDRKLEYIDRLDHESDLYKDYYLKLSKEKKSIRDKQDTQDEKDAKAEAEAKKKRLEQRQSEAQKLIKEGMEAASKLEAEYESRMQSIVNAVNNPEKVTDANGNERLIFTDFGKKLREIRKYQENLGKLEGLGLSEQHLKDIFSMDLDTRMKYIDELLKMTDSNRQRYLTDYEDYYKAARATAETETDLSGKDDEILNEGIDKALNDITDNSYIKGKEAREAWLQGWKEGGGAFYEDMIPALKNIDSTDPARQTVTAALSGMMQGRMVINIAGTEVINKSFKDILNAMKNSGGILDV